MEAEERCASGATAQVAGERDGRFRSLAEQVPGFGTIKDSDGRYLYLSSLWGAVERAESDERFRSLAE